MELDANEVIAALRRQNADLSYRLALAEAQIQQQARDEEPTDGTS